MSVQSSSRLNCSGNSVKKRDLKKHAIVSSRHCKNCRDNSRYFYMSCQHTVCSQWLTGYSRWTIDDCLSWWFGLVVVHCLDPQSNSMSGLVTWNARKIKQKNTQPSPKQQTVNRTQPHTKIKCILSITVAHNSARFHENCLKTCRAILFTVERTNRQTDKRRRQRYLFGGGNLHVPHTQTHCWRFDLVVTRWYRSTKLLYAGPG